jgi:hypothetical protein
MMRNDVQIDEDHVTVLGGRLVPVHYPISTPLYFGPTRGKEPAMWWRFWTVWCGPRKNGEWVVITCRCPIHKSLSTRLDGHSANRKSRYWMRRAHHIEGASPAYVARWKRTHRKEWRRIKYAEMGPDAIRYALACRVKP